VAVSLCLCGNLGSSSEKLEVVFNDKDDFRAFLLFLLALGARRGCQYENQRQAIQGIDGVSLYSKAERGAMNIGCAIAG
jgi:hypothetical protein